MEPDIRAPSLARISDLKKTGPDRSSEVWGLFGSVPTTPDPNTLQKYRDTNGRRSVMQIGGVYTTFCPEEVILWQQYRDRNGRCIAILFKSIGVRGRFDSPDLWPKPCLQITAVQQHGGLPITLHW